MMEPGEGISIVAVANGFIVRTLHDEAVGDDSSIHVFPNLKELHIFLEEHFNARQSDD